MSTFDGNRRAKDALRATRLSNGLTLTAVADHAGVSRQTLGGIERRRGRATPTVQASLAALYDCGIDDLFDPVADQHYRLAADGEWITLGEAARMLDVTGETVRHVPPEVIPRRGGRSRRQYHCPTVEALVPSGYVRLSHVLRDLEELAAELGVQPLTPDQIWRRRRRLTLETIQPWPNAEHRLSPVAIAQLEDDVRDRAERQHRQAKLRRSPRGEVPDQLKEWMGSDRHQAVLEEARAARFALRESAYAAIDAEIARRGLHDNEAAARLLDVSPEMMPYYRDVSRDLAGERIAAADIGIEIDGVGKWAYSSEAIRVARRRFAKRIPAPDPDRDPERKMLGKTGMHLVETKHIKNQVRKGNISVGSPEERAARARVKRRRAAILPITARVTKAAASGGSAKGKKEAREARKVALELIRERPHLSKRILQDACLVKIFGRTVVFDGQLRRNSRDPIYRRARSKLDTRLARSFTDEGVPAELAHLFGD